MTVGDVRSLWGLLWAHLSPIASPGLPCLGSQEGGGNRPSAGVDVQPGLWLPHPFQESWRGGRGRPRLAWSSGLIFPASIDPAASPESISSWRVKISPIVSPDLRQGGIHSNLFKQRKAVPSDLYSNLFQAGRGSGWGGGKPWHLGAGPRPGPQPRCQPGWQLVLPMVPGGEGPSRGAGREARQPSQQALLGWRDQLWIWFSQNTKPPTWSLSPRHWGLCQACAHPLRLCQGGGWARRRAPAAPAGLSGRGPILLLGPPTPSQPFRNRVAQAQRGPAPRKSSCAGGSPSPRAPHHGTPKHISMTQCACFVPGPSKSGLPGVLIMESHLS